MAAFDCVLCWCALCITDIIFCIYLYQRWIYRVDPKRVNEFGTSAEMLDEQQVDEGGQNGAVPAIDASPHSDEATGDALGKPDADKKRD